MRLPAVISRAHLRRAGVPGGVLLGAVLLAVIVGAGGLFGFAPVGGEVSATATVAVSAGCDQHDATERVTVHRDGHDRQAILDGCGHRVGETIDVTVPADAGADPVAHAGRAATRDGNAWHGAGLILMVLASLAGAYYAVLLNPKPRKPFS
jgi:hypothetical protein